MKVFSFTCTIFLLVCLTGCSNHEIVENELTDTVSPRTISLKASMPYEEPNKGTAVTRVLFEESDEEGIILKWKEGDKISLCFVSEDGNTVKTVSDVAVTIISENGERGNFEIAIPEEINGTFNLYGVFGASFSPVNSTTLLLPSPVTGTALNDNESICVMRFAAENLTAASSPQVSFNHLGSIFALWLYNDALTDVSVSEITLSSFNHGFNWLKNSSGQGTYDIKNNNFIDAKAGSELVFTPAYSTSIAPGASFKLYHWIVPGDAIDPSDNSKLIDIMQHDKDNNQSIEPTFARTIQAGKYYILKMVYDSSRFRYIKIPTDKNLVAYWPFDGNADDVVGTNHGTINGNVTLTTDRHGNENSAYHFDGNSGDYIKCISPGVLGTQARTISFWAKADALSNSEQAIVSYGGTFTDGGARFEVGLLTGVLFCDVSNNQLRKNATAVTNSVWNFYTVVFIGGSNQSLSTGVQYYVNGSLLTEINDNIGGNYYINTQSNNPIYFGSLYNDQRWFKGAIDEVEMYNRALNFTEVKGLYYKNRQF